MDDTTKVYGDDRVRQKRMAIRINFTSQPYQWRYNINYVNGGQTTKFQIDHLNLSEHK